jgi:putative component of membrane protein insertase Oxa1/YidC/SpoIIIJ protein YidD
MATPDALLSLIRQEACRPVTPPVQALADRIRATYGDAAAAILFYGSCLRAGEDRGGMVDLYVLVDSYRAAYSSRPLQLLNRLLPPNVFYLEVPHDGRRVRAKYAVLSLADFERGASPRWFHSYIWGRFAQPVAIVYARDPQTTERVSRALARAVVTFIRRVLPCTPAPFTAADLWFKGLSLSYRAELRAERPEKLKGLVARYAPHYAALTAAALQAVALSVTVSGHGGRARYDARIPGCTRFICRQSWRLRFFQGKILSVLRLLKSAFTFVGGMDYILWKVERHSGVRVDLSPRLRRRPLAAAGVLAWRLYRKGGFR